MREGTRLRAGLVLESGEPREVHHFATLIGYGASAINPYLMFDTVDELVAEGAWRRRHDPDEAERNVVKALGKGLLKTISKMGISTIQSYCGAQIFEAVGLERELVDRHFTGTASRIGGIGLDVLAPARRSTATRAAWPGDHDDLLPVGGVYAWRRDGEHHMWNPETIALLQHAVRVGRTGGDAQREVRRVRAHGQRGRRAPGDAARAAEFREDREPVPLDEVEPAKEIVKRFATGAMSLGSISTEAHETLAIAMNRLGGRSNTGEGGEDPRRFTPDPNGDLRRSAIKQVASGRFGVTIHYLVNADQLQIKMAQGAKPGEGGQLPGHKVDKYIGWVRHTTPGVGPDLAAAAPRHLLDRGPQAAHLRPALREPARAGVGQARRRGRRRHRRRRRRQGQRRPRPDLRPRRRHRRLAAELDPVAPACRGRSAWPRPSRRCCKNDLRSRIVVQTDGQLKTGRDVAIAAMLGADEFGFSTAPLIATGCIMMRACHLNTCPVGIATQDPELRKRFEGKPEHVVNFFFFVAEELRGIMASLGVAHGRRADRPQRPARGRRGDRALEGARHRPHAPPAPPGAARGRAAAPPRAAAARCSTTRSTGSSSSRPSPRSSAASASRSRPQVRNVNRCVGGMLSSQIAASARRRGPARGHDQGGAAPARPARASAAGWRRA